MLYLSLALIASALFLIYTHRKAHSLWVAICESVTGTMLSFFGVMAVVLFAADYRHFNFIGVVGIVTLFIVGVVVFAINLLLYMADRPHTKEQGRRIFDLR